MESVKRFITARLKLKVNESNGARVESALSAVAKPQERKFLGFSFVNWKGWRRSISPKWRKS